MSQQNSSGVSCSTIDADAKYNCCWTDARSPALFKAFKMESIASFLCSAASRVKSCRRRSRLIDRETLVRVSVSASWAKCISASDFTRSEGSNLCISRALPTSRVSPTLSRARRQTWMTKSLILIGSDVRPLF